MSTFEGEGDGSHFEDWDISELLPGLPGADPMRDSGILPPDVPATPEAVNPADESVPPAETLARAIQADIRAAIAEAYEDFRAPAGVDYKYQEPTVLLPISADMAEAAASAGDTQEVERHLAAYDSLSAPAGSFDELQDHTRILYAGAMADNARCIDELHHILDRQREHYEFDLTRYEAHGQPEPPEALPDALRAILRASDERGIPADVWKQRVAINENHLWEIEAAHLAMRAADTDPDHPEAQAALDAHISTLTYMESNEAQNSFVIRVGQSALAQATDPTVRHWVLDRLEDAFDADSTPLTSINLDRLVDLGTYITEDVQLATPERVAFFEQRIPRALAQGREMGIISPEAAVAMQGQWNIALAALRISEVGPEGVIASINQQTVDTIATMTEAGDDISTMRYWERDNLLGYFVGKAAAEGDFDNAVAYLNNMSADDARQGGLQDLLWFVRTPEEVAAVRNGVDPLARAVDPLLNRLFERADILVGGDVHAITAEAESCARGMSTLEAEQEVDAERQFIDAAFQKISQLDAESQLEGRTMEPWMPGFARAVLAAFRETAVTYKECAFLSKELIAAGDPDEPEKARAHIIASESGIEARLEALWELSKDILKQAR